MNTVIVPVDFSSTSLHTARYAAQLMVGHVGVHMLVYHGYSKPSEEKESQEGLDKLKEELVADFAINVETLIYKSDDFPEGLQRVARHRKADLIIMGITGKSALAQIFFGSNTLKMVETRVCPILIVPEKAAFNEIKNVMLTSDFKDTVKTTPSTPIKDFLSVFNPHLHIVNVDKNHYISLTTSYEKEKQELYQMFEAYDPEFYFMRLYDVNEALTLFAHDKNIDLIILIRRDESLTDKLFRTSHTKNMTYHSTVPILVIHE
ncbi:MAG: universal stress protein [Ferruginibacter sp.]